MMSPATDPRWANSYRRRQLRQRLIATTKICEVCGEPLDPAIPPGHPLACEVDERTPIAAGGNPLDKHDTRLIHAHCNKKEWQRFYQRNRKRRRMPTLENTRNW